jgi:hypothetical protein
MVDAGKITLKVRVDHMPWNSVHALSMTLAQKLKTNELGVVTAVEGVDYEPFTADSPMRGLRWNQIEMYLDRDVELDALLDLLALAGAPASSHLTYTVKMHMAGSTLSEVVRGTNWLPRGRHCRSEA